jgi:hypothetical protein
MHGIWPTHCQSLYGKESLYNKNVQTDVTGDKFIRASGASHACAEDRGPRLHRPTSRHRAPSSWYSRVSGIRIMVLSSF